MIILFLVFIGLIVGYIYYHVYSILNIEIRRHLYTSVIVVLFIALMFFVRLFMGFMIHLLFAFIFVDLIYLILKKCNIKKIISKEIIALIIASLFSVYGMYNVSNIQYISYDVYVDKDVEDIRMLVVSDVHLSTAVNYDDLSIIKDKVEERNIDYVVIAGDLFDETTNHDEAMKTIDFFEDITELCPVYYVVGNHDSSQGQTGIDEGLLKEIDESKIIFLKDEVVETDELYIAGRLDRTFERKESEELVKESDKVIVLLDHQPLDTKKNSELGVDLQIAGHTHNGQIFPFGTICKYLGINEVEYGHEEVGDMDVIVSSGMGTWGFAMKSQGNSEIVEINIKAK